jgi:hypothetical protein
MRIYSYAVTLLAVVLMAFLFGRAGDVSQLRTQVRDLERRVVEVEARAGRAERDLESSLEWSWTLEDALTEAGLPLPEFPR